MFSLLSEGRFCFSIRSLENEIATNPTSDLWIEWAELHVLSNRDDEAERGYRNALLIDATHAIAAARLGNLLLRQGRHEEARPLIEHALQALANFQASEDVALQKIVVSALNQYTEGASASSDIIYHRLCHYFEGTDHTIRSKYQDIFAYFTAGQSVLDLGCGSGITLEELSRKGVSCVGIEHDANKVYICQCKGLDVRQSTIQEYVSACRYTFDGVLLLHVIEHLTPRDAVDTIVAAKSLLKPCGHLVIVTPHFAHSSVCAETFWLDVSHVRPYPLRLLRALVELCGLTVREARISSWSDIDVVVVGQMPSEAMRGSSSATV